jgi:lysophospholipase L1-like esterase
MTQRSILLLLFCLLPVLGQPNLSQAQPLLEDQNGDELITVDGFGDSICYGTGDGTQPGDFVENAPLTDGTRGWLQRVRTLTGIRTNNLGVPGDRFTDEGIERFPGALTGNSDIVAILDGTNDARFGTSPDDYRNNLQRAINVARARGKQAVLFTLLPPCCSRAGGDAFTRGYSSIVRELAIINSVALADIERAWDSTCPDLESCSLYNRPDGLHPNTRGYDAVAQVFLATLAEIDIFSDEGQMNLADAIGIPIESIVVVPDAVTIQE